MLTMPFEGTSVKNGAFSGVTADLRFYRLHRASPTGLPCERRRTCLSETSHSTKLQKKPKIFCLLSMAKCRCNGRPQISGLFGNEALPQFFTTKQVVCL
eukprot:187424-Pleurochrysis_carterae.AAC.1